MRFSDIPQFTRSGSYQINVPWKSIEETLKMFDGAGMLDLDPDFQRAHVWTEDKQIKFVEFVLKGGKSSRNIFFNSAQWLHSLKDNPVVLVDGKQRLEAVRKFMRNELKIFGDNYFKDFTDTLRMHYDLIFVVNDLDTRAEVLQWYLDLNTGGVVHTTKELDKVRKLLENEK